jgi:iron complex outermembrane receptor protein
MNSNGVDLAASYKLRTKDYGNFTLNYSGTWVHKYDYQNFIGDAMHTRTLACTRAATLSSAGRTPST